MDAAVDELLTGWQHDFPVIDDAGHVVGMLLRTDIVRALNTGDSMPMVAKFMRKKCYAVVDTDMLDQSLQQMQVGECSALPVVRDGRLVGLLTSDSLSQWLRVRSVQGIHQLTHEPTARVNGTSRTPEVAGRQS